MEELFIKFFEKLSPTLEKISNHTWVQGLSSGMMATLPLTVLGSFSLLAYVIPFKPLTDFVSNSGMLPILSNTTTYTLGLLAVYMVIFITKNIVHLTLRDDDGVAAAVAALFGFLILTPGGILEKNGGGAVPVQWLGASGAFSALIVAMISSKIFIEFKQRGFTIKMPEGVPPMVANVFAGIIPTLTIGVLFMLVGYVFSLTSFGSLHQAVYSLLQAPMQQLGGSLGAVLIVSLLANILWFFGIHGQNVIMPFVQPLWMALDIQNLEALAAGHTPPNIAGFAFYSLVNFGGYQLALIFLLMRSRSKRFREVGKLTLGPSIFGIGEPMNFGLPLVLNFKFLFPFLTNSLLMLSLSYFVIKIGLVPHFNGSAHVFGLPIGFGAFLQGGVRILILQIVTQILPIFLWYPWFKIAEKEAIEEEKGLNTTEFESSAANM
ncbi:PTS transporter subunit EIIC [Trichococcus sp. K1Tr]|uniref:PTS sugar transporter subunit IIC n=1 Tax=Trichococcus sp. K1Tr TaxID=3020847 RepID=UPI00233108EC|nr:PTS transporter subunit EIIC [Trichococcus sp. K1Tr]MDB6354329.1 PTS transporter subunit EIIC [Trichococcus sp. K1Tr]